MTRTLILTLITLLGISCTHEIPKEIRKAQREFIEQRETQRTLNGPDVVLPPIETVPVYPSVRSLSQGNWGYSFLEIDRYEDFIRENAKRPVAVFVFDTGGAYDHDGLKAVRGGKTFTREEPLDLHGHSTHVAGTYIGEQAGRDVGICKVLIEKDLVHVRAYKVLRNSGAGSYGEIANGILEANKVAKELIEEGYFVIYNFSLGGSGSNSYVNRTLKEAEELGVLISMAASGNTYREGVQFPGNSEYTIAIGAHDRNGRKARFSTTGDELVFSFPGLGIYSTYKDNGYAELSGTSMATPHAGAMAALVASVYPGASASEVLEHMKKHATDRGASGRDKEFGYGIPKASDLFSEAPDDTPDEPDDTPDEPDDTPDEPDDTPDEPEEPSEPEPEPRPERTDVFTLEKYHIILWREMSEPAFKRTPVQFKIRYTHNFGLKGGAQDMSDTVDDFFQNRGYMLRDGSNELDAAFWAAYFLKMIEGKKGRDFDIVGATIKVGNTVFELNDFERKPTARRATESNAITFEW